MSERVGHNATAWGIEYADGDREWSDSESARDIAFARDVRLTLRFLSDYAAPVAKIRRDVVTTLTITREAAAVLSALDASRPTPTRPEGQERDQ